MIVNRILFFLDTHTQNMVSTALSQTNVYLILIHILGSYSQMGKS